MDKVTSLLRELDHLARDQRQNTLNDRCSFAVILQPGFVPTLINGILGDMEVATRIVPGLAVIQKHVLSEDSVSLRQLVGEYLMTKFDPSVVQRIGVCLTGTSAVLPIDEIIEPFKDTHNPLRNVMIVQQSPSSPIV